MGFLIKKLFHLKLNCRKQLIRADIKQQKDKKRCRKSRRKSNEIKPQEKECCVLFPDTPLQLCPAPPEPAKVHQAICSWKMELIIVFIWFGTYSNAAAHMRLYIVYSLALNEMLKCRLQFFCFLGRQGKVCSRSTISHIDYADHRLS